MGISFDVEYVACQKIIYKAYNFLSKETTFTEIIYKGISLPSDFDLLPALKGNIGCQHFKGDFEMAKL
jgi:hypothetical protein